MIPAALADRFPVFDQLDLQLRKYATPLTAVLSRALSHVDAMTLLNAVLRAEPAHRD
jgi:hypothetical protein